MNSIVQMRERATRLKNGLAGGVFVREIIINDEHIICDMNAEQQLYEEGINRLGVKISDYAPYSPLTIEIKTHKGQPTDRVTLRDTGEFHGSFYVEATNTTFEIKAADWKTEKLLKKYGKGILGLTEGSLAELVWQYIYPELINKAKEILYGN